MRARHDVPAVVLLTPEQSGRGSGYPPVETVRPAPATATSGRCASAAAGASPRRRWPSSSPPSNSSRPACADRSDSVSPATARAACTARAWPRGVRVHRGAPVTSSSRTAKESSRTRIGSGDASSATCSPEPACAAFGSTICGTRSRRCSAQLLMRSTWSSPPPRANSGHALPTTRALAVINRAKWFSGRPLLPVDLQPSVRRRISSGESRSAKRADRRDVRWSASVRHRIGSVNASLGTPSG